MEDFKKSDIISLSCKNNESIMEALRRYKRTYSFPCGGKGICGKCKIQVLEGVVNRSPEDGNFFSEEELCKGYRLACRAFPDGDCVIKLVQKNEDEFMVLSEFSNMKEDVSSQTEVDQAVIGIDIGTTTLAIGLVDHRSGDILAVHTAVNRQRAYGLDVIARIQAACEGKGEELQQSIRQDLLSGIDSVIEKSGILPEQIRIIAIACNTTMGHLLMGYPCETLGAAPFTPVDIDQRQVDFRQVFNSDRYQIPVFLLPGISTFVGADVVAGILKCAMARSEKVSLFIDLGTNGEMAIGNRERIYVASTAVGPAFEGGNISCGTGSIAGAIYDIHIDAGQVMLQTIGDMPPIGVCGTGSIAVVAELLQTGLIDVTGLLDEDYFETGFLLAMGETGEPIVFSQKDIREIQLAKSAVRAGIETLLLRYGVTAVQVDTVYLAGGFGHAADLKKITEIGLMPEELQKKVTVVGNSSLAGAIDAVCRKDAEEELKRICTISVEVNLSGDKEFNEYFMKYMMFESDTESYDIKRHIIVEKTI